MKNLTMEVYMRLKKSQFKKIIMLMSILLGISVILCTANIILLPYISEMTTKYNEELKKMLPEDLYLNFFGALQAFPRGRNPRI